MRETHRHPDIDTPRNRHLVAHLERVSRRAQTIADTALGHRLKTNVNRFLRSLPLSPARRGDPVPGHLDARYQTAFALIRALNRALAPCVGGPFDLSYRDTHVLYEYWIYFALIQALRDLGFAPTSDRNLFRLTERGLRVSPTQGEPSAIHLQPRRASYPLPVQPRPIPPRPDAPSRTICDRISSLRFTLRRPATHAPSTLLTPNTAARIAMACGFPCAKTSTKCTRTEMPSVR